MKQIIFLLFASFLLFTSCNKNCPNAPDTIKGDYLFNIPIAFIPEKETYSIGDTIQVISEFNHEMMEQNTGIKYNIPDFPFPFGTYIAKIDTLYDDSEDALYFGFKYFETIIEVKNSGEDYSYYQFSSGSEGILGNYHYDGLKYSYKFTIIPQKAGLYFFRHGGDPEEVHDLTFEGQCKGHGIATHFVRNEGTDSNFDLLQESPTTFFNTSIPQQADRRFYNLGGYCFYVVE